MQSQFENLKIERIIFHRIYKRDENGIVAPTYNTKCENLESADMSIIKQRVISAVGSRSRAIQMDIGKDGEGSVFKYVTPVFSSKVTEAKFIEISRQLTDKLVEAQSTRRMPGGVVIIFEGTTSIASETFIGIIKAEEDNGFALQEQEKEMTISYIRNLLLTKNQKIYKVAIIIDKGSGAGLRNSDQVHTFVYDSNNNVAKADAKATYFYDAFMGCKFQKSDEILTRNFYFATKTFIQSVEEFDGEKKVGLMSALHAYLNYSTKPNLNMCEFSEEYFDSNTIRDRYLSFMDKKEFPTYDVRKNFKQIATQLKKRKIRFTNSITLEAPAEDFNQVIDIKEDNDKTIITIKAKVTSEA